MKNEKYGVRLEEAEMVEQGDRAGVKDSGKPFYWRKSGSVQSDGIVVVTAWIFSKPQYMERYSSSYASCNWDSLISHPKVLNLWFPELAKNLALRILDELSQELEKRPRPVVFATFSGGYGTCLWKIYQMLQGTCDGVDCTLNSLRVCWAYDFRQDKYKIVKDCFAGQIHDSSPVDFVSEVGARFLTSPSVLGTRKRIQMLTTSAYAGGKVLDFFFIKRFRAQNLAMWSTLQKSGEWGPILLLCCKDDDLAPFDRIQEFFSTMTGLGYKVTLLAWDESAHVDHMRRHEDEYKDAVRSFLIEAKMSHALKRGLQLENGSGHVELNQTNSNMIGSDATFERLSVGRHKGAHFTSDPNSENGLVVALTLSRL